MDAFTTFKPAPQNSLLYSSLFDSHKNSLPIVNFKDFERILKENKCLAKISSQKREEVFFWSEKVRELELKKDEIGHPNSEFALKICKKYEEIFEKNVFKREDENKALVNDLHGKIEAEKLSAELLKDKKEKFVSNFEKKMLKEESELVFSLGEKMRNELSSLKNQKEKEFQAKKEKYMEAKNVADDKALLVQKLKENLNELELKQLKTQEEEKSHLLNSLEFEKNNKIRRSKTELKMKKISLADQIVTIEEKRKLLEEKLKILKEKRETELKVVREKIERETLEKIDGQLTEQQKILRSEKISLDDLQKEQAKSAELLKNKEKQIEKEHESKVSEWRDQSIVALKQKELEVKSLQEDLKKLEAEIAGKKLFFAELKASMETDFEEKLKQSISAVKYSNLDLLLADLKATSKIQDEEMSFLVSKLGREKEVVDRVLPVEKPSADQSKIVSKKSFEGR